jgi:hypothetical protein
LLRFARNDIEGGATEQPCAGPEPHDCPCEESCRQTRSQAEAYLISALERGRELCTNRAGTLLTRLVGIACQKSALNEMTALYTRTGDHGKLQSAQGQLQQIEAEAKEIRSMAQQAGQ